MIGISREPPAAFVTAGAIMRKSSKTRSLEESRASFDDAEIGDTGIIV